MFNAGCAGDLKGGSLGDPIRALELETMSLIVLLLSVVSCGAGFIYGSKSVHRVAHGLAFAMFMLFGLWLSGIQIELWGVQSCY